MGGGTATGRLSLEKGVYTLGSVLPIGNDYVKIDGINLDNGRIDTLKGQYPISYFEGASLEQKGEDLVMIVNGDRE